MNFLKNNISKMLIITILLCLFLITISSVNAAEHNITNTTAGGLNKTVTDAINGDTINLDNGIYTNNVTNITINKNLTIQGKTPETTIIDAQKFNRIFNITSTGVLTLINITLINGYSDTNGGVIYNSGILNMNNCILVNNTANYHGACIYSDGNYITINRTLFTNNEANGSGGCIYTYEGNLSIHNSNCINNSAGTAGGAISNNNNAMIVSNCTFVNNSAYNWGGAILNLGNLTINDSLFENNYLSNISSISQGGALYNEGYNLTNVKIINSNFTSNKANYAGAIYNAKNINITLVNSNFVKNSARYGGAIYNSENDGIFINNCNFISNNATTNNGGGIFNYLNKYTNITNSTFINNTANNYGGAIHNQNSDNLLINNSNFINNSAITSGGGGILTYLSNHVTIINSTFTNNTGVYGGGFYNYNSNNTLLTNSSFNDNKATYGGAIYNYISNDLIFDNLTLTNNKADTGAGIYNSNSNITVNNSGFINNIANNIGGSIYNSAGSRMTISKNYMEENTATLGNEIYNNGFLGILNLTYLSNSTIIVNNNTNITLYATLTDDMGNTVTGQNISFYVNGIFIANITAIEGYANVTHIVNHSSGIVSVLGDYTGRGQFTNNIAEGQLLILNKTIVNGNISLNKNKYLVNETTKGNIVLINNGSYTAYNVTVKINFPSEFTLNKNEITVSHGYYDSNTNIWYIGNLNPNEEATMNFTGKFTKPGKHTTNMIITGQNFNDTTDSVITIIEETSNHTLTNLETNNPSGKNGETVNITAKLTDVYGNPIVGRLITFHVAGMTLTAITNANGIATVQYTINEDDFTGGKLSFTATFEGDDNYLTSSDNGIITLIEEPESPKPPEPQPEPEEQLEETNENNEIATAEMKETGIPIIAILIVLLSTLGLVYRKK